MRNMLKSSSLIATAVLAGAVNVASATELEVTHWWTSGGEANAVGELAKAFDATGHTWVDGAIAGSGGVARPIIISRIIGGEPMGATQLNHGRQAEELIEAGLLLDLTDVASATELEVTHWWTSGGEANAVGELAKAFDATGHTWVDGAIAGSGGVARPIIISRIIGGEPMGATQLNHGRQAEELIEAGLLLDLTDVAEAEGWRDVIYPPNLLDACTVDGRVYCAPVNIHSAQWLWLSHDAYESSGVAVPTNWDEFVAAGPALRANGIVPLAQGQQGWQT